MSDVQPSEPFEPLDPSLTTRVADRFDRYEKLLRLADVFDAAGEQLRGRAGLGAQLLREPALLESADLSVPTYQQVEDDIRAATTGRQGLMARSIELDADALVVRATVLTYQWIDDLRDAAYHTLGAIAGRAIGYLAPEVALGGVIVTAGLIETDALDRDGVAAYLSELAVNHPELMDHVTSGGGGLLDSLQMRALLTAGVVSGDPGRHAARAGLRAVGVDVLRPDSSAAVRDVAGGLLRAEQPRTPVQARLSTEADLLPEVPRTMAALMRVLQDLDQTLLVQRTAPGRYIGYLGSLRLHGRGSTGVDGTPALDEGVSTSVGGGTVNGAVLVGGDVAAHADAVARGLAAAVDGDVDAHFMLVGGGAGGALAARLAAHPVLAYVVDTVVTAGAPAAQVPRLPAEVRTLALEDRADPVALLGSLVNAGQENRTTVVFDAAGTSTEGSYVAGGRAADAATTPALVAEVQRLRDLGYLSTH